jgi:FixJ family two-component response regulator
MPEKSRGTVLVVDDDPSVLRALSRLLLQFGFDVVVFDSAESFLSSEIPGGPVSLLLDIYLPGMGGIELCAALAAAGRSVPVILMSARDDEGTKRRARQAGAVAILYKPIEEEVLLDAVNRALAAKMGQKGMERKGMGQKGTGR